LAHWLGKPAEAEAEYRAALKVYQRLADEHPNISKYRYHLANSRSGLGNALSFGEKLAEAEAEYGAAIKESQPLADGRLDMPVYRFLLAHSRHNLGLLLVELDKRAEAEAEFAAALRGFQRLADEHPNLPNYRIAVASVRCCLGDLLAQLRRWPEAEAAVGAGLKDVQRLAEQHPTVPGDGSGLARTYTLLGNVFSGQGKQAQAEVEFRQALKCFQRLSEEHPNALRSPGEQVETDAEFRRDLKGYECLVEKHPNIPAYGNALANSYYRVGIALFDKGDVEGAIREYQAAIQRNPKLAVAHCGVGKALREKGDLDGAVRAYQVAIERDPNLAGAYCNLGHILVLQSRFADALTALKRGHELGSKTPTWPFPSAQWVRNVEQFIALEGKLPKFLTGEAQPAGAAGQLALARWCRLHKRIFASATRFYAQAFAAQPELAGDLATWDRYDAACAAARAGCGQGEDAARLDDRERARLRNQALDWLHADLAHRAKQAARRRPEDRVTAQMVLPLWLADSDLCAVRGEALAKLPEAEQQAWRQLWSDVASTLAWAWAPTVTGKKSDTK
jgi:tetratricopeptide (TPR) repeat protein